MSLRVSESIEYFSRAAAIFEDTVALMIRRLY